jgi:hypothetical protein
LTGLKADRSFASSGVSTDLIDAQGSSTNERWRRISRPTKPGRNRIPQSLTSRTKPRLMLPGHAATPEYRSAPVNAPSGAAFPVVTGSAGISGLVPSSSFADRPTSLRLDQSPRATPAAASNSPSSSKLFEFARRLAAMTRRPAKAIQYPKRSLRPRL